MSNLIQTDVAYSIVKECCEQLGPLGPALKQIQAYLDAIDTELSRVVIPTESGITLPGRGIVIEFPKVGSPTEVSFPVKPVTTPKRILTIPWPMVQEVTRFVATVRGLLQRMGTGDPCFALLGCVAEGLRKRALTRGKGPRYKVVDKTFLAHWQAEGLLPKHLPKRVQHIRRRP